MLLYREHLHLQHLNNNNNNYLHLNSTFHIPKDQHLSCSLMLKLSVLHCKVCQNESWGDQGIDSRNNSMPQNNSLHYRNSCIPFFLVCYLHVSSYIWLLPLNISQFTFWTHLPFPKHIFNMTFLSLKILEDKEHGSQPHDHTEVIT